MDQHHTSFFVFIEVLGILLLTVIIHEFAHYIYVKATGDYVKTTIEYGSPTIHFLPTMDKNHQIMMYLLAILSGLFVMIPFIFLSTNGIIHIATLIIYLVGCNYDIYQIYLLIQS